MITGRKVSGPFTICAYDLTRCWEKLEPCTRADTSSADDGVETKS